ncbi:unnamed protein product, partial [Cyprideis torosa]
MSFESVATFMLGDSLTVYWDITPIKEQETLHPALKLSSVLVGSGEKLFNGLHSDLILMVHDREFRVHKCILAAASPVFARMFEHEMLEKTTDRVKIEDISAEVMEELVRFIYIGEVRKVENIFEGLHAAAAKYDIQRLQEISEKQFATTIGYGNFHRISKPASIMTSEVSPIKRRTSDLKISEFSFQWIVKHVSLRTETFHSGEFNSQDGTSSWKLSVHYDYYQECIRINLSLVSSSTAELNVKAKIYIFNGEEENRTTATLKEESSCSFKFIQLGSICVRNFSRKAWFEHCVFNDTLTIQCNITIIGESVETTEFEPPMLPCSSPLVESGEKLFSLGLHSDITLVVEDRKFALHKNILAAQSPVFASMFDHDMLEKQTGEVKITDFSAEVIEELLRFMYTGNVRNIERISEDLFSAAAKYDLERLQGICEKQLACSLTRENFYRILVLADLHQSAYLEDALVRFARQNPELLADEEWASDE